MSCLKRTLRYRQKWEVFNIFEPMTDLATDLKDMYTFRSDYPI